MTGRLGISTVAAAWPSGVVGLAEAIRTCQACTAEARCREWLARAAERLHQIPPFCPNAKMFERTAAMGRPRSA